MLNRKWFFIILFILVIISILLVFILKIDIKELVINKEWQVVNKDVPINRDVREAIIVNKETWTFQSSLWWGWR